MTGCLAVLARGETGRCLELPGERTSVGTAAILRPVCYQDFPDALLPAALKHALLPLAQISTRIGGASTVILATILLRIFV